MSSLSLSLDLSLDLLISLDFCEKRLGVQQHSSHPTFSNQDKTCYHLSHSAKAVTHPFSRYFEEPETLKAACSPL